MKLKTIFKNTLLIALGLFIITSMDSCKNDKKDDNPTPTPTEDTAVYFSCKLDGVNFIDDSRYANYGMGQTTIRSLKSNGLIRIDFGSEATGTIPLSNGEMNVLRYVDASGVLYKTTTGTLIITKYDKTGQKISGTFTGTLKEDNGSDLIAITEGKFNNVTLTPF